MLGVMQTFANANNSLNPVLLEDVNYTDPSPSGSTNKFKRKMVTTYQPQVTLAQPTIVSHTIVKPRTTTAPQTTLPVPVQAQKHMHLVNPGITSPSWGFPTLTPHLKPCTGNTKGHSVLLIPAVHIGILLTCVNKNNTKDITE